MIAESRTANAAGKGGGPFRESERVRGTGEAG
jgi:hypothetical protein